MNTETDTIDDTDDEIAAPPRVLNEPLIRRIVEQIEATPEKWDQSNWVTHNCETKFCFAGWAMFLDGYTDGQGTPTAKGFKLIHDNDFEETFRFNGLDSKGRPVWDLPYEEAAAIVLGIEDHVAEQLFSSAAAERHSWDDADRAKDDLTVMKRLITELTGVEFTETQEPAAA